MKIEICFSHPINGFWDGGPRTGGTFTVDRCHQRFGHTCFGSWMLNHWFNVKTGKTNMETVNRAKRYLKRHCKSFFTFGEVSFD